MSLKLSPTSLTKTVIRAQV